MQIDSHCIFNMTKFKKISRNYKIMMNHIKMDNKQTETSI